MTIGAAGLYGLTLEKFFIDTAGESLEAEDHFEALVQDGYTPNFDAHDFFNDITNECTGTNYTSGGVAVTSTEITLSTGTLTYDAADTVYTTVTISGANPAMAGVIATSVSTPAAATNQLVVLQDFINAASATAANFTIQHSASGIFTLDYTP